MEIREHALLYALICRTVFAHHDEEEAERLIEKITKQYGHKRGKRMRANSKEGSLLDFFVNGEWKGRDGENSSKMIFEEERTLSLVTKCAWHDTWEKYGLLEYGKYYCRHIDKAICEGYDSAFGLEVEKDMGKGDECCIFVWNEKVDEDKLNGSKKEHILAFDHHVRELYGCAREVLNDKEEILREIASSFKELTGEELAG